jgi:peptidoglycan hydrolase CwlO-like protein
MKRLLSVVILVAFAFFLGYIQARADEYDDINTKLIELKRSLDSSQKATATNEQNLQAMNKQLSSIKSRVYILEQEIVKKEKEVKEGETALSYQKNILNQRTISHYKNLSKNSFSLVDILVAENISNVIQNFFYQKSLLDEDRRTILKVSSYIKDLQIKKDSLLAEQTKMNAIKLEVDKQSKFLAGEVNKAKDYQKGLEGQIANLSARQKQIVAQKLAALNIPRSAGTSARGCSSDLTNGKDPGFSPRFGFFTYGAPHRNGLNQYGAWGRAKSGQNEEQILQAYYPSFNLKKDYDQNIQISTDTGWSGSIEDYVKRIFEVPDSWTDNNLAVLKAQAVAARTYALRSTGNGANKICTTEACQVFHNDPKGGNWEQAVEATKGWVMMDGGSPGFTQYASTHGGYVLNLGKFDGSGNTPGSFAELNERAYDKDSPWFYCNWGSRSEYSGTAWMKSNEVADILNVIELARRDSGVSDKLYQPDKPNPNGGEVWNPDRVKQELRSRGGSPLDTVNDISVSVDFGSGKTTSVSGGGITVSANEFKDWFNLRAPANIQIVGPLFNIERR